jgi:hypothetical protein
MSTYPDDVDGAVLADLAAQGVDMTQPLTIEFPVAVPNEASANGAAKAMAKAGYEPQIEYDEGEPDFDPETDDAEEFGPWWTVYAIIEMIPEYDEIMRIQAELDRIARPFGGKSDGWGVMLDGDTEE